MIALIITTMKATACEPGTDRAAPPYPLSVMAPHTCAIALWFLSVLLFWQPLVGLLNLAVHDENSSHVLVIPLISVFLLWLQRKRLFRSTHYSPRIGVSLLFVAVVLGYGFRTCLPSLDPRDQLSIQAACLALAWMAIFILSYGASSFRSALFPMLYLILMIPLPATVVGHLISFLQKKSADLSYALFRLIGVPVLRHGFRFSLPGVDIDVAPQCSGIHSALALFIAGLLAAHVLLQCTWKKVCFVLCVFPIAIFKNAVRIVTIAWIGVHVNPAVFQSRLHRQGGLPFSLVAFALMAALLWLLRRRDQPSPAIPSD